MHLLPILDPSGISFSTMQGLKRNRIVSFLSSLLLLASLAQHVKGSIGPTYWLPRRHAVFQKEDSTRVVDRASSKWFTPHVENSPCLHQSNNVGLDLRCGAQGGPSVLPGTTKYFDAIVATTVDVVTFSVRNLLPPVVASAQAVIAFYRALPVDAIRAQAGLVYCFAGGSYPTLFAAIQAARQSGYQSLFEAISALTEEAAAVLEAVSASSRDWGTIPTARELFMEKTKVVLATVDPVRVNQAVSSLYTSWMGISIVLEKEFARTIALSLTIGEYLQPVAELIISPPVYRCVSDKYHKWVPVILGWGCKAAAISIAWRLQRILTAYTTAITGGLMFSRACFRMLARRGVRLFGLVKDDNEKTILDEMLGMTVAGLGMYHQVGNGFSLNLPFPLNLVTWPFDVAEKWIQWQITKPPKSD